MSLIGGIFEQNLWAILWDKSGPIGQKSGPKSIREIFKSTFFMIFRPKSGPMGQKSGPKKIFVPRSNRCGTRVSGFFGPKDHFLF